MPQVSVIIPLYNKGPYIARAMRSVLGQTFQDFEAIVVDDGSTDGGAEVVRRFDDARIRLVREENRGASIARNRGVALARSDFIALLDADDEWMPSHLETLMGLRDKFPEAGIYTTSYEICATRGAIRSANFRFIPDPPWEGLLPDFFRSAARGHCPIWVSAMAIPRRVYLEAGGFHPMLWCNMDTDLWGKIALKYPVAFSWEPGMVYHADASNRITDKFLPVNDPLPFVGIARRAIEHGEVPRERVEPLYEYICLVEMVRAIRNIRAGNRRVAAAILRQIRPRWNYRAWIFWRIMAQLPYPVFRLIGGMKKRILTVILG